MEIYKKIIKGIYWLTCACMFVILFMSVENQWIKGCYDQVFKEFLHFNTNLDHFKIYKIFTYSNPFMLSILEAIFYGFKINGIVYCMYCFIVVNIILILIPIFC